MRNYLARIGCVLLLSASALLLSASAVAQEAAKSVGLKAGNEMPFFVVDFSTGKHKDHGGCPSVMTSNAKASSVILFARTADEPVLTLAKALTPSVDGTKVLGFLCVGEGRDADLASASEKYALGKVSLGIVRDQSLDHLKSLGLSDEIAVAAVLLDRKDVKASYLLKSGELTPEKQKEIAAALANLAK